MHRYPSSLKRRRPHGTGEPSPDPPLFPSPSLDPDFTSLSLDHQRLLDHAASIYGLSGFHLHQLVQLDRSNKRQRLSRDYLMEDHFHTSGFAPGDDGEKGSYEARDHVANCAASSGSAFPPTSFQQVASGLANLRCALCSACFTRLGSHEADYQALAGPSAYEYGIDKPYEAEKPPSAQGREAEEYIPMPVSVGAEQSQVYASGSAMPHNISSSYREMPDVSPITTHNTKQDVVYYPSAAPLPVPYTDLVPMSAPLMGHDAGFSQGHTLSSADSMVPYDACVLPLESSPPLAITTTPLVPTHPSQYPLLRSYGTSGHDFPAEQYDVPKPSPDMIVVPPNQKAPATKRGPFQNQELRELTAQTRRIGSCIRCRMQRIRCHVNPEDTEGACLTCNKSKQKPNPKIWKLPCLRAKITEVKLFKPGQVRGREWTQRWKDSIVDNITTWDVTSHEPEKMILVTEGYTPQRGISLRVKRFKFQPGDTEHREWASTATGEIKQMRLPPYAIVDLQEAETQYKDYITDCVASFDAFGRFVSAVLDARPQPQPLHDHGQLRETYALAWELSHSESLTQRERELLKQALRLWVAIRLTTASTTIVGNETLGIKKMPPDSPQSGQRPVPPVMGAQIDTILRANLQVKWRREMLEILQKMTQENKQSTWMTTYLVTFILLHNVALITEHDANYATKHQLKRRWAREEQVKEYVFGANILLAYFHYCNKGVFPFSEACREQELRGLAELDERKFSFVQRTRQWAIHQKRNWDELHREEKYEDSYFWVSQLYKHNWTPQLAA